ncbi:MAG TPA: hypothetical protein PKD87_11795 [Burkholderiaceae bacterium]|nr:hypothetical protein [Burkholderiaceae bacterium]
MKPEIARGEDAKRILEDPLFIEAWEKVEKALVGSLRTVPLTDAGLEREIVRSIQLLYRVRAYVEEVLSTGKLVAIDEQQAEWRRKGRRG